MRATRVGPIVAAGANDFSRMVLPSMKKIMILVSVFALAGCTPDIDSEMTEYSFGSFVTITCNHAESQRSQYEKFSSDIPEPKHSEIRQAMLEAEDECEVLKPIHESVKESYKELDSKAQLPRTRYIFRFAVTPGDTRTVGFFETEKACRSAKEKVGSLGYEAEKCQERTLFLGTVWA